MTYEEALKRVEGGILEEGEFFEDPEILKLSDKNGWSIAHEQARKRSHLKPPGSWKYDTDVWENEEILTLTAHYEDIDALELLNTGVVLRYGLVPHPLLVLEVLRMQGWQPKTERISKFCKAMELARRLEEGKTK